MNICKMLVAIVVVWVCPMFAQAPNRINGTWELNLKKSTFNPGPPPPTADARVPK